MKNQDTKVLLHTADPDEALRVADATGGIDGVVIDARSLDRSPVITGASRPLVDLLDAYRDVVQAMHGAFRDRHGDGTEFTVVMEPVDAGDADAAELCRQARMMREWVPGARIALPITPDGLVAANAITAERSNVLMTHCHRQHHAAVVHALLWHNSRGQVLVAPDLGRLRRAGLHGLDLVDHVMFMFTHQEWNSEKLKYERPSSTVGVFAANINDPLDAAAALRSGCAAVSMDPATCLGMRQGSPQPPPRGEAIPAHEIDMKELSAEIKRLPLDEKRRLPAEFLHDELTDAAIAEAREVWHELLSN